MTSSWSLVFDVSSSSVGAAFSADTSSKPTIVWSKRIVIPAAKDLSVPKLEIFILKTIADIAKDAAKAFQENKKTLKNIALRDITIIYGAPWHMSKQVRVSIKRDTPFTVTPKFIESVIKFEEDKLLKDAKENKYFNGGPRIADRFVTDVALNGYHVQNPYQKNIKDICCSVFLTVLDEIFSKKVEQAIHRAFHVRQIFHNTAPLASWSVLRSVLPTDKDFIGVLIGEEVTEVFVSRSGELEQIVTFPAGKYTLARALGQNGADHHVAMSLVKLQLDGNGEPEWVSQVNKQTEDVQDIWFKSFCEALRSLSVNAPLPKTIMFLSDEVSRALFANYVKNNKLEYIGIGANDTFTPLIFDEGPLADLVDNKSKERDSNLEMAVLYNNLLAHPQVSRV